MRQAGRVRRCALILVPRLWIDPLGPMLKVAPIIVLNLVALASREDLNDGLSLPLQY
jgi:hypothetical protein